MDKINWNWLQLCELNDVASWNPCQSILKFNVQTNIYGQRTAKFSQSNEWQTFIYYHLIRFHSMSILLRNASTFFCVLLRSSFMRLFCILLLKSCAQPDFVHFEWIQKMKMVKWAQMLKCWSMLRNDCTVSVLIQKIFLKCKHKMKKTRKVVTEW